jgi:hypothetical protein
MAEVDRGRRLGILTAMVVLVAPATVTVAGAATVFSETTWGGANDEVTNGAAVAADGSTHLAGFTTSFDAFGRDNAFVVKFTPQGSLSWQRTFDGPGHFSLDRRRLRCSASTGSRCRPTAGAGSSVR